VIGLELTSHQQNCQLPSPLSLRTPIYIKIWPCSLVMFAHSVAPARKERSANSVQRRSASLIHLAKDIQSQGKSKSDWVQLVPSFLQLTGMELKKGSRSGTKKKSRCQTEFESYNNRNELTHCGKEQHLAKDRPTRQLSSQLQAQQANEHREKLFSKSKRKGRSGFSLIVCVWVWSTRKP